MGQGGQVLRSEAGVRVALQSQRGDVQSGGKAVPADANRSKTNYTVKSVETVVVGTDVQARIFTLAPGEVIPWHTHSETTDHYFVLGGKLTIERRTPDDRRTLVVGERYQITAGNAHALSNRETEECRFLLLQGVGRYDWIRADR
jgi:quercetin dioxygenase-like cupin family protein